ncbi:MAG: alpha/beta hydrolase [Rhodobacteraceae bacterium]|nr:alpha/beta hydrolase [Paracoccaceae bacterium]
MIDRIDAGLEKIFVRLPDGRSMCWRAAGEGPSLVLVHGGAGSWLHWIANVEALSQDFRVIIPDLPGFGDSDPGPEPATLTALAVDMMEGLHGLISRRQPINLAGFSLGGAVAARFAAMRGEVSRVCLIGTAGTGTARREDAPLRSWRNAEGAERQLVLRRNMLAHMLHREESADRVGFEAYSRAVQAMTIRSRGLVKGWLVRDLVAMNDSPCFYLWGDADVTCTPTALPAAVALRQQDRLTILPGIGHWAQFEAAAAVNHHIREWLNS